MILCIYKISKDFMNFKDSLKWNDYNTLSIIIFSIYTIFFRDIEMKREMGREEREGERERGEGGREERDREWGGREREREIERVKF